MRGLGVDAAELRRPRAPGRGVRRPTRSVRRVRGRGVRRCSTASWWRRTRISLRPSHNGTQHHPAHGRHDHLIGQRQRHRWIMQGRVRCRTARQRMCAAFLAPTGEARAEHGRHRCEQTGKHHGSVNIGREQESEEHRERDPKAEQRVVRSGEDRARNAEAARAERDGQPSNGAAAARHLREQCLSGADVLSAEVQPLPTPNRDGVLRDLDGRRGSNPLSSTLAVMSARSESSQVKDGNAGLLAILR
jgi:hypothetical protein